MTLSVQWLTMLTMLLSGIGMGIVFDGYRVVSDELRISRWWIPVFDLLYWIAATIAVFQVLSASNEGEVRTYVFLGLLIGIVCYYLLFSKIVVLLVHGIIRAIRAIIQFAIRTFVIVIIRPLQLLYRCTRLIFAFVLAFTMFLIKVMIQLFRPLWLLVKWILAPIYRPLGKWIIGWGHPLLSKWRVRERYQAIQRRSIQLWQRFKDRKKDKVD
ncbi:spore cortex biosynthesis protein YabQ [Paenibacillus baekrokdamisoli]|uniref:spore cortex biosynthesis protein YabQ n=1 Tax=Paenibacillus baekrokdamisoli TaxID=1712516 RepID=UPI0018284824|nr:spore cortex biosynthesis protein YabQ [Paenibacillus baekrokdamisoli]MBB3072998.1 spore cortex biosynthesis protein YabQ [Paenibacillus baekrokdamisoli]